MQIRRKLVVGNWKMNGNIAQLTELHAIADAARAAGGVDVAVCPPFTLISSALTRSGGIAIGAQDCHAAESGAHTGYVSAAMLKEAGARLVIVGHSERRAELQESDRRGSRQGRGGAAPGLIAIVCVGESEPTAPRAITGRSSSASSPARCPTTGKGELVIAYEPVWAIGTGKSRRPGDVTEMHGAIRTFLTDRFGDGRPHPHSLRRLGQARQCRRAVRLPRRRRRPGRRRQPDRRRSSSRSSRPLPAEAPSNRGPGGSEVEGEPIAIVAAAALENRPASPKSPQVLPESSRMFTFLLIVQTLVAVGAGHRHPDAALGRRRPCRRRQPVRADDRARRGRLPDPHHRHSGDHLRRPVDRARGGRRRRARSAHHRPVAGQADRLPAPPAQPQHGAGRPGEPQPANPAQPQPAQGNQTGVPLAQ